jgi:hypothetical protein
VAAPLLVAVAVATGLGWRAGYLCPVLPVAVVLVLALRRPARVDVNASVRVAGGASGRGMEPGRLPGRWLDVLLAVSVEFCMVFWSADALSDWQGAHDGQAPAVAALFLVGMAIARAGAGPLTGTGHPLAAVFVAVCVAAGGFAVFWTAPTLAVAGLGLLVTGAGVGLLYPLTVSRAVAAWPQAPDRAAARAALASGLAIGGAPFVLARLADSIGLRAAYLIVPVLLVALAGHAALTLARSTASRHGCPT